MADDKDDDEWNGSEGMALPENKNIFNRGKMLAKSLTRSQPVRESGRSSEAQKEKFYDELRIVVSDIGNRGSDPIHVKIYGL